MGKDKKQNLSGLTTPDDAPFVGSEIDIKGFMKEAKKHKKEMHKFIDSIDEDNPPRGYNDYTMKLSKKVFAEEVDCRHCANCCKKMTPTFNKMELRRVAKFVGMKPRKLIEKYLIDGDDNDLIVEEPPCPFLGKDNLCTIYEVRPLDCRDFPHTHKPEYHLESEGAKENILYCPAVFKVIEGLMEKFGDEVKSKKKKKKK